MSQVIQSQLQTLSRWCSNIDTLVGGTGYANGTAIATTTVGSGSGLTLDLTTSNGLSTGVRIKCRIWIRS
ncbi:MAG: hypothetical protein CM15mV11_0740 [Caudoviricetes sp.]|nr:MAG: hypothetical protein CM15mV11_0740 [Caudoviricetes sp.]